MFGSILKTIVLNCKEHCEEGISCVASSYERTLLDTLYRPFQLGGH